MIGKKPFVIDMVDFWIVLPWKGFVVIANCPVIMWCPILLCLIRLSLYLILYLILYLVFGLSLERYQVCTEQEAYIVSRLFQQNNTQNDEKTQQKRRFLDAFTSWHLRFRSNAWQ